MSFLLQLPTGKTVKVNSLNELLNFDYQAAIAENRGRDIVNPFFDTHSANEESFEEDIFNIDLPDIDSIDELSDIDEEFED